MFISDKDIFMFVNYPSKLAAEKKLYINKNMNIFQNEIEFYQTTKEIYENESEELDFLFDNISDTIQKNSFFLNRIESPNNNENKLFKSDSFIDEETNFLVKVLTNDEETKIYIFNKDNSKIENFYLNIYPTEERLFLENNSEPLVLEGSREIKKI